MSLCVSLNPLCSALSRVLLLWLRDVLLSWWMTQTRCRPCTWQYVHVLPAQHPSGCLSSKGLWDGDDRWTPGGHLRWWCIAAAALCWWLDQWWGFSFCNGPLSTGLLGPLGTGVLSNEWNVYSLDWPLEGDSTGCRKKFPNKVTSGFLFPKWHWSKSQNWGVQNGSSQTNGRRQGGLPVCSDRSPRNECVNRFSVPTTWVSPERSHTSGRSAHFIFHADWTHKIKPVN